MPFIGLTTMTGRGMGRAPPSVLVPIFPLLGVHDAPQGRGVSSAGVAGRGRINNTGVGCEGLRVLQKTQGYQTIKIKHHQGKAEAISLHRPLVLARNGRGKLL